jgi:hypothetical protein
MMDPLIFLGFFGGCVSLIFVIGRLILGPIDRLAKARREPARIALSDFLCLFIAVQLPLTLVNLLNNDDQDGRYFWAFIILAWFVAPMIWYACASTLSRAGISSGKHRLVFMGLVLPIVYYGLIPAVVIVLASVVTLALNGTAELFEHWWIIFGIFAISISLVACGWYTKWLARQVQLAPESTARKLAE